MKFGPASFASKSTITAEPDARGSDAADLTKLRGRMTELADEKANAATKVVDAKRDEEDAAVNEAELVAQMNAETRALERDNNKRLTEVALRDIAIGLGTYVLAKIVFGGRRSSGRPEGRSGGAS